MFPKSINVHFFWTFLDILGQVVFVRKKFMVTNYLIIFLVGDHKNFYAVANSLKFTSTLFTNKVLRISKLDIYKCPFLKSGRKFSQKRVSVLIPSFLFKSREKQKLSNFPFLSPPFKKLIFASFRFFHDTKNYIHVKYFKTLFD